MLDEVHPKETSRHRLDLFMYENPSPAGLFSTSSAQ